MSCTCSFRGTISRLSLLLSAAVPGPSVSVAGMTGERCQSARSATASSWRISHTLPSCLPSILPLPIIVNQGGVVSAGGAMRQEIAEAAGCTEEHGCVPVDRGHWGPLSRAPPNQDGTPYPKPLQFRRIKRNGWETKGRNLDREQQLMPLRRTSGAGLSVRWRRCFLSRDGLVRKMT